MNHFQNLLINANFQFFYVQDSYKIPDRIESAAHNTPWRHSFVSQQGHLNHNVLCIVFGHQVAIIFIFIPAVLGTCSTDSFCSGIRTVIQQIEWPASCASTTSVSTSHTFYKKENWIDISSSHSMFHLTQQQASFPLGFILLLLRGFWQEEEKSSRFEGCNCVLMQWVGGLGITDQVCCPIWDLSEGCSSLLLTWPILILVSLGWSRRTTINEGVGPADKVGHLNLETAYSSKRAMLWPPQLEMIWLGSWGDRIMTGLKRLSVWQQQQQQQQHWLRRGTWNFNNI
jgi:hypothetical protein